MSATARAVNQAGAAGPGGLNPLLTRKNGGALLAAGRVRLRRISGGAR